LISNPPVFESAIGENYILRCTSNAKLSHPPAANVGLTSLSDSAVAVASSEYEFVNSYF
jgi:hypothetical protein